VKRERTAEVDLHADVHIARDFRAVPGVGLEKTKAWTWAVDIAGERGSSGKTRTRAEAVSRAMRALEDHIG
jgi:hypothetical protein